jgi:hypothetical protein
MGTVSRVSSGPHWPTTNGDVVWIAARTAAKATAPDAVAVLFLARAGLNVYDAPARRTAHMQSAKTM